MTFPNYSQPTAPSIFAPLGASTFKAPIVEECAVEFEALGQGEGDPDEPARPASYNELRGFISKDTPEERTEALLESIPPQRFAMLALLDFCRTAQPVDLALAVVENMQKENRSVFTPTVLCQRLEEAGALQRVTADGTPYADIDCEPTTEEQDGALVVRAAEPPQAFLVTTEAGAAVADEYAADDELSQLFDECGQYLPIYRYLLEACEGNGAPTAQLREAIDPHPLTQSPRMFAPAFVEQLERVGALRWTGTWTTTDEGRRGLELLAARDVAPL